MSMNLLNSPENLEKLIAIVPDFPTKGVLFRDITPLLASSEGFALAIDALVQDIDLSEIDCIAGIESRGFILAAALAVKFNKGFLPIRKKGKLPQPVISQSYNLEYGTDVLEMRPYKPVSEAIAKKPQILVVDDVLATGGTIAAALKLCEKAGYFVKDISFLINLVYLNTFQWQQTRPKAVFSYKT